VRQAAGGRPGSAVLAVDTNQPRPTTSRNNPIGVALDDHDLIPVLPEQGPHGPYPTIATSKGVSIVLSPRCGRRS